MLLNDAADIFMEAAKVAKYCRQEGLALAMFIVFTTAFLLLRLGWFPFMVIRSTLMEALLALQTWPPYYYGTNALLLVLLGLNCYWFGLVLRIAWMKLTTGEAHDVREEPLQDYQGKVCNIVPGRACLSRQPAMQLCDS
jgi:ceramide synthetase